jgi:hypothetical protein
MAPFGCGRVPADARLAKTNSQVVEQQIARTLNNGPHDDTRHDD